MKIIISVPINPGNVAIKKSLNGLKELCNSGFGNTEGRTAKERSSLSFAVPCKNNSFSLRTLLWLQQTLKHHHHNHCPNMHLFLSNGMFHTFISAVGLQDCRTDSVASQLHHLSRDSYIKASWLPSKFYRKLASVSVPLHLGWLFFCNTSPFHCQHLPEHLPKDLFMKIVRAADGCSWFCSPPHLLISRLWIWNVSSYHIAGLLVQTWDCGKM